MMFEEKPEDFLPSFGTDDEEEALPEEFIPDFTGAGDGADAAPLVAGEIPQALPEDALDEAAAEALLEQAEESVVVHVFFAHDTEVPQPDSNIPERSEPPLREQGLAHPSEELTDETRRLEQVERPAPISQVETPPHGATPSQPAGEIPRPQPGEVSEIPTPLSQPTLIPSDTDAWQVGIARPSSEEAAEPARRVRRRRKRRRTPTWMLVMLLLAGIIILAGGGLLLWIYAAGNLPPSVASVWPFPGRAGLATPINGGPSALTATPTEIVVGLPTETGAGIEPTATETPVVYITLLPTLTPTPIITSTPVPTATHPEATAAPPVIPTLTPEIVAVAERQIMQNGVRMVFVPGSSFPMGGGLRDEENPVHTVTLDAFYMDMFEVTNQQWAACVSAGACNLPSSTELDGAPYYGAAGYENYPVVFVNWYDASAYCQWRGARLPTEAEWEMAALWDAGSGHMRVYPWGDDWDPTRLNYCDSGCPLGGADMTTGDGWPRIAPVGSYPAGLSVYGVADMAGNVAEWVADWFSPTYYAVSPTVNPTGPATGSQKVVRGGAWGIGSADLLRGTNRSRFEPTASGPGVGFRCVIAASAVHP